MIANTHVMRIPAREILESNGLKYKISKKNDVTWYNLDICPVCKHNGFQCGLSESFDNKGRSIKGYKCQHNGTTDPKTFYAILGYTKLGETVNHSNNSLTCLVNKTAVKSSWNDTQKTVNDIAKASSEALAVCQKRLRNNEVAMSYLVSRGLTVETIERFKIGLTKPYTNKEGITTENALTFPLFDRSNRPVKKNAFYNVPGLTVNPISQNGWMGGGVLSYYAGNPHGNTIFVCEGFKDLWLLWQYLWGAGGGRDDILLVTSTNGKLFPPEWRNHVYWEDFQRIYLGQDNDKDGELMANDLVPFICRNAYRVRVPLSFGKDWTNFFQNGGTIDEFINLLSEAPIASIPILTDIPEDKQCGLFDYNPIDINGSFHNGHLHYTTRALYRQKTIKKNNDGSEDDVFCESLQTVVVRSDGAVLTPMIQPAPKGVHYSQQVIRLTDGTLISKLPTPSPYSTWEWSSIRTFQEYKSGGRKIFVRPLSVLVKDIEKYLQNQVWLPNREDFIILAMASVVTYTQTIFDAVPLFLVNGPKGSGKTELGRAMRDICANAALIGQGSAASIARLIDMTRGFVCLDDLEAIGTGKADAQSQYSELVQALKLSYKKTTSKKIWTDIKTMKVEELDFFGVKMINNTTGVDSILGSRMFIIQTRKRLPEEIVIWEEARSSLAGPPIGIRNELHIWACEYCIQVAETYQRMYSHGGERSEEIAAPLRVIAKLTGDEELQSRLEVGLARLSNRPKHNDDPIDLLEEALGNIVIEGYRAVATQHLILEMKKLTPENYGQEKTTEIPECFRREWVGRQLRSHGWIVDSSKRNRLRICDMNLTTYEIANCFIEIVRKSLSDDGKDLVAPIKDVSSFCQVCDGCQYNNVGCDIMPRRHAKENRIRNKLILRDRR